jgi:hypothetical protein
MGAYNRIEDSSLIANRGSEHMKEPLLFVAVIVLQFSANGQGTVRFDNRVSGQLNTQVFLSNFLGDYRTGNTSANTPSGTQTYFGAALTGAGWTASLWSAPGDVIPPGMLYPWGEIAPSLVLASGNATTTFRTGAAAGNWAGVTATLANVPADAPACVLQVRVYPSSFGSWSAAVEAQKMGNPAAYLGTSPMFVVNSVGGGTNSPAVMTGLVSFSVVILPEPSTPALLGLGMAVLFIRRRE